MELKQPLHERTAEILLFLTGLSLLSFLPYIADLGFYGDDWYFLANMVNAPDQSFWGAFRALYTPEQYYRPVQMLYQALLYQLFGTTPLGWHLVNAAVFTGMVLLFYLCLLKIRIPHYLRFGAALLYASLPHYSTVRFSFAFFLNTLSMVFFFASLRSLLEATEQPEKKGTVWQLVSLVCMVLCLLTYEIALPLFVVNLFLYYRFDKASTVRWILIHLTLLFLIILFKLSVSSRMGEDRLAHLRWLWSQIFRIDYGPYEYGFNLKQAFLVNWGSYGLALPIKVFRSIRNYFDPSVVGVSLIGAGATFIYTYTRIRRQDTNGAKMCVKYFVAGVFIFLIGYSIFLTNSNVHFSTAGIANRTSIAASIGISFSIVAAICLGGSFLAGRRSLQHAIFCLLLSLVCFSGLLINGVIGKFWKSAYEKQRSILAALGQQMTELPEGSVVLLDRVCPYDGPALVFESYWDFAGALQLMYRQPHIKADIIKPDTEVNDRGFTTMVYDIPSFYPYSANLMIFNYETKSIHRIPSSAAAANYFQSFNPQLNSHCPEGHEGHGVRIF